MFYRRNRTVDIVHKQVSLVHHVPSSESFQAYLDVEVIYSALNNLNLISSPLRFLLN
jgi:hypothetical protein